MLLLGAWGLLSGGGLYRFDIPTSDYDPDLRRAGEVDNGTIQLTHVHDLIAAELAREGADGPFDGGDIASSPMGPDRLAYSSLYKSTGFVEFFVERVREGERQRGEADGFT